MAAPNLVNVTGVPDITTFNDGTQASDFNTLAQQLSDSWVVVQAFPSIDAIPGVKQLKEGFKDIAQYLIQILDVVNQILQAAKTFVAAYANPLQTLTKILIEQIQLLIKDIKQIGAYITSDIALFKEGWPLKSLRGGYTAYQQRTISKLTNQNDPTRPEVSDQTYVLGMFFYLSVDISQVYRMIRSIQQLLSLFGLDSDTASQGIPSVTEPKVRYGFNQNNIVSSITTAFKSSGNPLTVATLEWTLAPPAGSNPAVTTPLPSPQGFLIEVGVAGFTELELYASRPSPTQGGNASDGQGDTAEPRQTVRVVDSDGLSVNINGGADVMLTSPSTSVSTAYSGNALKPGANFYFLQTPDKASTVLIPPDKMKATDADGNTVYYLQRAFKMSQLEIMADPTVGVYRYSLSLSDLPHKAEFVREGETFTVKDLGFARNYLVRISAISDEADQQPITSPESKLKYNLTVAPAPQDDVMVNLLGSAKPSTHRGATGPTTQMTFPAVTAGNFFLSLKSALALLVLLRVDLKVRDSANADPKVLEQIKSGSQPASGDFAQSVFPFSDNNGTGLEIFAETLFAQLVDEKTAFFRGQNTSPLAWCSTVAGRVNLLAEAIYQRMGSLPSIERYLSNNTKELRELTLLQICENKFDTPTVKIGAFRLLEATILSSLTNTNKDGKPILHEDPIGVASSPFQAFDQFNRGELYPSKYGEGPFMWYAPSGYRLLDKPLLASEVEANTPTNQLEQLGLKKGTLAQYGLGSVYGIAVDEPIYMKLRSVANDTKYLYQSEGWPVVYQYNPASDSPYNVAYYPYRALFDTPTGRKVMEQAQLVLNVAAASLNTQQGEWLSVRLGNTLYGGNLTKYLDKFNNYVKAINNAFAAATKVIIDYINFLQARIRELQRFIALINFYIQQMELFVIPQMAVLTVIAPGTSGVLASFTNANNKPNDGAASYGAGATLVVPLLAGTKFILDLIAAWQTDAADSTG